MSYRLPCTVGSWNAHAQSDSDKSAPSPIYVCRLQINDEKRCKHDNTTVFKITGNNFKILVETIHEIQGYEPSESRQE